jgi:hypothetical protein
MRTSMGVNLSQKAGTLLLFFGGSAHHLDLLLGRQPRASKHGSLDDRLVVQNSFGWGGDIVTEKIFV